MRNSPSEFVVSLLFKSGSATSARGIGACVESATTTPINTAPRAASASSRSSVSSARASRVPPCSFTVVSSRVSAPSATARSLNGVFAGTPQSRNKPSAPPCTLACRTPAALSAVPAGCHSATIERFRIAAESPRTCARPTTIPRDASRSPPEPHTVVMSCCAFGMRQSGWLFGSTNSNDARCVAASESSEGVRISASYAPGSMPDNEKRPRSSVRPLTSVPRSVIRAPAIAAPDTESRTIPVNAIGGCAQSVSLPRRASANCPPAT